MMARQLLLKTYIALLEEGSTDEKLIDAIEESLNNPFGMNKEEMQEYVRDTQRLIDLKEAKIGDMKVMLEYAQRILREVQRRGG